MIAVVDSGGANLASVLFALERLGAEARLTSDPSVIERADRVLLPGVGTAARAMAQVEQRGLRRCLRELKQPVLGICLGMQLLFERSDEGPVDCLGVLPGLVRPFAPREGLTVPHMGWNQVRRAPGRSTRLLDGIPDDTNFYFVHSYRAEPGSTTRATCEHGESFSAIVEGGPFLGVQFHPERSGAAGARLLKNFLEL